MSPVPANIRSTLMGGLAARIATLSLDNSASVGSGIATA
jgi:hypothetical protein